MSQSKSTVHAIILTVREPSLSPADFKKYYIENHLPLVRKLMGPAQATKTSLRFLTQPTVHHLTEGNIAYDCITELECRDQQHFEAMMARFTEVRPQLIEDEVKFLDTTKANLLIMGKDDHMVIDAEGQEV